MCVALDFDLLFSFKPTLFNSYTTKSHGPSSHTPTARIKHWRGLSLQWISSLSSLDCQKRLISTEATAEEAAVLVVVGEADRLTVVFHIVNVSAHSHSHWLMSLVCQWKSTSERKQHNAQVTQHNTMQHSTLYEIVNTTHHTSDCNLSVAKTTLPPHQHTHTHTNCAFWVCAGCVVLQGLAGC